MNTKQVKAWNEIRTLIRTLDENTDPQLVMDALTKNAKSFRRKSPPMNSKKRAVNEKAKALAEAFARRAIK